MEHYNQKNKTKTFDEAINQEYDIKKNCNGAGIEFGVIRLPKCLIGCKIRIIIIDKPENVTTIVGQNI